MQRQLARDELFDYLGDNGIQARCRVRIYVGKDISTVVIASELDDNPGGSVTNQAHVLWPRLIATYLPGRLEHAEDLVLIEHYPGMDGWGRRQRDTFDRVTFSDWTPRIRYLTAGRFVCFGEPEWRRLDEAEFEALLLEPAE